MNASLSSVVNPTAVRYWALIPCAGSGSRAGTAQPKQYQPLAGQAMVLHTLAAFSAVTELVGVLLVLAPQDDLGAALLQNHHPVLCGGETRAHSVANGLAHLQNSLGASDADWVLVHDAARCLITPAQIRRLITACAQDPVGGLLAQPLADTLKVSGLGQNRVSATLDRADKWLAQTPQMFRVGALRQALDQALAAGLSITDEASAMEAQGLSPRLVAPEGPNFKVTYPEDFALAEAVLLTRRPALASVEPQQP
jgi:2-C-methyl-D-erythritol 4-phosphate cytidylyltransferase